MTWQGWGVLILYLTLALGGIPLVHAAAGNLVYAVWLLALTVLLVVTCWLKGEPPRRRSGSSDT